MWFQFSPFLFSENYFLVSEVHAVKNIEEKRGNNWINHLFFVSQFPIQFYKNISTCTFLYITISSMSLVPDFHYS